MSHDRELDAILEMDINPEGDIVDPNEQRFRDKYLSENSEQLFRLAPIDESAMTFAFNEGDRVSVRGTPATIQECRGYRVGHTLISRYLVKADDGRSAEVDEAQIKGVLAPSPLTEALNVIDRSVNEEANYPSQEDAELCVQISNSINAWPTGGTGDNARRTVGEIHHTMMKFWQLCFGDSSPWEAIRKGNKAAIKWNKEKAQRLGLDS